MKKAFLFLLVFCIQLAWAQKVDDIHMGEVLIRPPKIVKENFDKAHPNADEEWQMELNNYLADYVDDSTNIEYNVVYDKRGNLIRTDRVVNETSFPGPIKDYHDKYYPNEKYYVWHSEDKNGKKTYYSKHKSGPTYFDQNGNYTPDKKKSTK